MKKTVEILTARGYTEKQAKILGESLSKIDASLKNGLDKWLEDVSIEKDFSIHGITLSEIKKKFNMTYIAALLSMDWVIREPDRAVKSINNGIK
ncbi:hypothetical protein [Bacteroides sp. 519]|uniref:hypothetical protein n=1 Tax=Bacteroides sp. 519 TaxID=2302937 RepID=UPI0013D3B5BE|nr:hypothetical protein [Bacteroides sp. 519]NDV59086.1 hypothetical protein [Bacteroides sp. 519]